jgi:uncharacterized protein YqhQ
MEYTYEVIKLIVGQVCFILIFKEVSDPHVVWRICFVTFYACVTYALMFWSGDTGGIEIMWDY